MVRKVCIPVATRGNYAKTKSVMRAIRERDDLELQVLLTGGIALPRFGDYGRVMAADGFPPDRTVHFLIEGDNPITMAKSAGFATIELAGAFNDLRPDVVLIIADRYEALSFAQAAMCLNVPIAHLEGGEISGSIDERIRHAITKLAHIHLPASQEAAQRLERLGETPDSIHVVGSPSFDLLADIDRDNIAELRRLVSTTGVGARIDLDRPYAVVSLMPVVTEYESAQGLVEETVGALDLLGLQAVWLWPNMDAGADRVSHAIRAMREHRPYAAMHFFKSLPFEIYAQTLVGAACFIGNSSSGIRESAFLGVPVVNVGSRQQGRARGRNVIDVGHDRHAIAAAARRQIAHGRYPSDPLYGDGHAGRRIAEVLAAAPLGLDKRLTY